MDTKNKGEKLIRSDAKKKTVQESHNEILQKIMESNFVKPTNVEAQRILRILDELQQNMEILAYLDTDFISAFYDISDSQLDFQKVQALSTQILELFQKEAQLENKYYQLTTDDVMSEDGSGKDESYTQEDEKEIDPEEQARLDEEKRIRDEKRKKESDKIAKIMCDNLKTILRQLRQNPEDFNLIKALRFIPQQQEHLDILQCVQSLRIIMLKKLSTAAEEEESHTLRLKELKEIIDSLEKSKGVGQAELSKLKKERAKHCVEKKEEIEKLKKALEDVKNNKKDKASQFEKNMNKQLEKQESEYKTQEDKLSQETAKLKQQLAKLMKDNDDEEQKLKSKKKNTDESLAYNINQYDEKMEQWTQEKGKMNKELGAINKELKDLREHFRNVDQEMARERELQLQWQKKQKEHKLMQDRKDMAARHIQIAYRDYKNQSKKGKKKGKKKK